MDSAPELKSSWTQQGSSWSWGIPWGGWHDKLEVLIMVKMMVCFWLSDCLSPRIGFSEAQRGIWVTCIQCQQDEFSCWAQGSSHCHHDQASSHQIPLSLFPLHHNLVRQYGQWTSICCFVISLAAPFLVCFPLSHLGFICAHTAALYFTTCICCTCLMLP